MADKARMWLEDNDAWNTPKKYNSKVPSMMPNSSRRPKRIFVEKSEDSDSDLSDTIVRSFAEKSGLTGTTATLDSSVPTSVGEEEETIEPSQEEQVRRSNVVKSNTFGNATTPKRSKCKQLLNNQAPTCSPEVSILSRKYRHASPKTATPKTAEPVCDVSSSSTYIIPPKMTDVGCQYHVSDISLSSEPGSVGSQCDNTISIRKEDAHIKPHITPTEKLVNDQVKDNFNSPSCMSSVDSTVQPTYGEEGDSNLDTSDHINNETRTIQHIPSIDQDTTIDKSLSDARKHVTVEKVKARNYTVSCTPVNDIQRKQVKHKKKSKHKSSEIKKTKKMRQLISYPKSFIPSENIGELATNYLMESVYEIPIAQINAQRKGDYKKELTNNSILILNELNKRLYNTQTALMTKIEQEVDQISKNNPALFEDPDDKAKDDIRAMIAAIDKQDEISNRILDPQRVVDAIARREQLNYSYQPSNITGREYHKLHGPLLKDVRKRLKRTPITFVEP